MDVKTLSEQYIVADPTGATKSFAASEFWQKVSAGNSPDIHSNMGYLISQFNFDEDWKTWEIHPEGEEFVFCVSGRFTFVLEIDGQYVERHVNPGQYVVVPKNTWHRAKADQPVSALFVTWGHGTQHKDVNP